MVKELSLKEAGFSFIGERAQGNSGSTKCCMYREKFKIAAWSITQTASIKMEAQIIDSKEAEFSSELTLLGQEKMGLAN